MHIFIATDGTLDPQSVADTVCRMYEDGDEVTVFTAINLPRDTLRDFGTAAGVQEVVLVADAVGPGMLGFASGAKAAERLAPHERPATDEGVERVAQYFSAAARRRLGDIEAALAERGVKPKTAWSHTDNQTARTILDAAKAAGADLLVIGSHGRGGYEGALGSTGTKLVRRAPMNVTVIRRR